MVESRLQRLIRRRRFTEAEMLARTFKLPLQDLHKAKATFFTELLSPWREPKPDDVEVKETLEELTKVLRQVEDLNFVVECCVTAALPKLNELRYPLFFFGRSNVCVTVGAFLRSLLLLARDAIRNNSSQQDVNLDLMARVSSTLQRLETFLLTPESGESRSDRNADIDQWVQFSRAEMSAECAKRLSSGRLDQAKTIWDRHRSEFSLDPSTVQSFLDAMASKWDVKVKYCTHNGPRS